MYARLPFRFRAAIIPVDVASRAIAELQAGSTPFRSVPRHSAAPRRQQRHSVVLRAIDPVRTRKFVASRLLMLRLARPAKYIEPIPGESWLPDLRFLDSDDAYARSS